MLLCKKIKIEVSQQDAEALEFMQAKCRGLYNWWVMRLRNGERWRVNQAKKTLRESKQYDPELRYVYGKLLAEVYYRLDGAMQAFFRRVQLGENPGFPRVKPRHQFFTHCYPAMYLEVQDKMIILPTGGGGNWGPKRYENIVAHLTEEPPDHFHEVAVSRDERGNYYCSFVYDAAEQSEDETRKTNKRQKNRKERPMRAEGIVAFDLGIKTLTTGYTDQGRFYHIGGFKDYRYYDKQLDKIHSKRDKCQKKSRRYIYLSKVYKRVSVRKRHKQRDCLHMEIGGGLNFERKRFLKLEDAILAGEVERVVIAHQDRLVRFGFALLKHVCETHQTELMVMNTETLSPEAELVQDLITITHCFSSRLYGLRNYRKALEKALKDENRAQDQNEPHA